MPLNLNLLRVFTAVVDAESFSRAASVLYVSQPAISKGVSTLERQIGTPLFDRSGRVPVLTETGRLLYEHAQRIFAAERSAEIAIDALKSLETGTLEVGASMTTGTYLLPPVLGEFHRRYPGIRLALQIANTRDIVQRLWESPLDMVFVEGSVEAADLLVIPWRVDSLVVIAAPDHPLAKAGPIPLERLIREPFIMREPGSGTRDVFEKALARLGVQIQVAMELGSTEAVKQAVCARLGIAVVSNAIINLELAVGALCILDVPDLVLERTLTHVQVKDRPPSHALKAFQALLSGEM